MPYVQIINIANGRAQANGSVFESVDAAIPVFERLQRQRDAAERERRAGSAVRVQLRGVRHRPGRAGALLLLVPHGPCVCAPEPAA